MKKITLISFLFILAGSPTMTSQTAKPSAYKKNAVFAGPTINIGSFYEVPFLSVYAGYERYFNGKLSVSIFLEKTLVKMGGIEYDWNGTGISPYAYDFSGTTSLFGMCHYKIPVVSILSLRLGAGLGVAYHRRSDEGRIEGLDDKVLPYLNVSAHWILALGKSHELRFPLLLFLGPGNASFSPISTEKYNNHSYMIDIGPSIIYAYKF